MKKELLPFIVGISLLLIAQIQTDGLVSVLTYWGAAFVIMVAVYLLLRRLNKR